MSEVIKANGWKIFMVVVAVITALSSHLGAFPWLPVWVQHAVELGSFIATIILSVLIDPKKALERPTLTELRNGAQKVLVFGLIGAGAMVSSCAHLTSHLPHLPNGSLDVRQLVSWASDGVEADCLFAPTSSWCILGRDVVADTRAAMDKDRAHLRAAAKQSLTDSFMKWPAIKPVFRWLDKDLD